MKTVGHRLSLLLALALAACAQTAPPGGLGSSTPVPVGTHQMPQVDPDPALSVADWWAKHPLNPDASGGIPIGGIKPFANVVSLKPGDNIQAVIDQYQDQGVTIRLLPGTHYWPITAKDEVDPTNPKDQFDTTASFSVVTRGYSNIQIVADQPGTVTVKGRLLISGLQYAIPKGSSQPEVRTYRESVMCKVIADYPRHDECWNVLRAPPRNIYIKNITFDGGGEFAAPLVNVRTARDVVLDNVTFKNNTIDPNSHHAGQLEVASGSNNVWVRGARFLASAPGTPYTYATYMDGLHGGGVIRSEMTGVKGIGNLFLTNDDFSEDVDDPRNGIQPEEHRNGQYLVVAGNLYANVNTAISMSAAHTLIEENRVPGLVNTFVNYDAMCSRRYPKEIGYYRETDHLIRRNTIRQLDVAASLEVTADTLAVCLPVAGVGKVRLEDNTFSTVRQKTISILVPTAQDLVNARLPYSSSQVNSVIATPNTEVGTKR